MTPTQTKNALLRLTARVRDYSAKGHWDRTGYEDYVRAERAMMSECIRAEKALGVFAERTAAIKATTDSATGAEPKGRANSNE